MDLATKERAYGTWLGFYKGYAGKLGWDSAQLVQEANHLSEVIGVVQLATVMRSSARRRWHPLRCRL